MMSYPKNEEWPTKMALHPASSPGFSLVELMVTMTIFGILMTGVFQAYIAQMQSNAREYNIAESDIDRSVGQGIITRDILMAGYGLADDYSGLVIATPWALQSTNSDTAADNLTLMGTALGMDSQQAQHWSYVQSVNANNIQFRPRQWQDETSAVDSRENLSDDDMVIILEASTKRLFTDSAGGWLFRYVDTDNDPTDEDSVLVTGAGTNLNFSPLSNGTVLYGLYQYGQTVAAQPFYAVHYHLSSADGDGCATGVKNLLRAESRTTIPTSGGDPIIPCVADFQVVIGLDTDNDRETDLWKNGGVSADATYDPARLNRSLRQVRVYALTQIGQRDNNYIYPSATIYVGDQSLGTGMGRTFTLSNEQRHYRWRVIRLAAVPRNIR